MDEWRREYVRFVCTNNCDTSRFHLTHCRCLSDCLECGLTRGVFRSTFHVHKRYQRQVQLRLKRISQDQAKHQKAVVKAKRMRKPVPPPPAQRYDTLLLPPPVLTQLPCKTCISPKKFGDQESCEAKPYLNCASHLHICTTLGVGAHDLAPF